MTVINSASARTLTTQTGLSDAPAWARIAAPFVSLALKLRRATADRHLRSTLADMDDALLRDIGIAEDEIYRIRARERFTPRAWAARVF